MKPVDFRNATFDALTRYIVGQRECVFKAWGTHGPCTTKELADRCGASILSVRPRTNELVLLGFVRLHEKQASKAEGTYRVATPEEFADFLTDQRSAASNPQRQLPLNV